jgi:beta-glucosidase
LKITTARDGGADISARIRNAGRSDGDEVAQVYLGEPADHVREAQFPVRKLVAFDRVFLKAGLTKTVRLHVPLRQFQYWSTARHQWMKQSGKRVISLGASSRDFRLEQAIYVRADSHFGVSRRD